VRELRQYLSSIYDAAQRSEASASSPTSSVSISFDQADQEELPTLELDGEPSPSSQRMDRPGPSSAAAGGSRSTAPPLGFGLFGARMNAASANTSLGGGLAGNVSDVGRPESPVDGQQEHASRAHLLNQAGSSTAPVADAPLPGTSSLSSRLIRFGRGYTG
jgi:hypothetical protein